MVKSSLFACEQPALWVSASLYTCHTYEVQLLHHG